MNLLEKLIDAITIRGEGMDLLDKGIVNGIILSLPFWVLILLLVC